MSGERTPADEAPASVTPAGSLTGMFVILDYLEAIAPEPALLPADPFARAKVQELARGAAQILDPLILPGPQAARSGAPLAADMKGPVHGQLDRAVATVLRLARFEPWFAGDTFSQADIVWHFSFDAGAQIAHGSVRSHAEIAPAAAHRDAMAARPVQRACGQSVQDAVATTVQAVLDDALLFGRCADAAANTTKDGSSTRSARRVAIVENRGEHAVNAVAADVSTRPSTSTRPAYSAHSPRSSA